MNNFVMNSFTFNKEKTLNVILYISKNLKSADFHKIFKLLYFADRNHLAEYGTSITGDRYIAMDAGPVPSKTYDILKIVRGDSYIKDAENFGELFCVVEWMFVQPKKEPDLKKLSPNEKEIIDDCISTYGSLTYDEIKEKSHDIAWRNTAKDFEINIDDIAHEAGLNSEEIQYIHDFNNLQKAFY